MSDRVIIDTQVLVLLTVGLANPRYITDHKRLKAYDATDFGLLKSILANFQQIIFIPHVSTETSHLIRDVKDPRKSEICAAFDAIIHDGSEMICRKPDCCPKSRVCPLGLTDAALMELASAGTSLLTADMGLYLAAASAGFAAINFAHIQAMRPDFR